MKAYTIKEYGQPEKVLTMEELDLPTPKANEILLKVKASTVNDYDWSISSGQPKEYRLFFGPLKPRKALLIPGMEVAGIVEKVGSAVQKFKVGDPVFGDTSDHGFGSYAEFMCIHENAVSLKPDGISFEDAASLPHASLLAYQGLALAPEIKPGRNILVNGGGGGVGSFALQLAKAKGAHVTGVDSGPKLESMKAQGFDEVVNYKEKNFTKSGIEYDLIIDCKTSYGPLSYLRALKPHGHYITVGGRSGKLLQILFFRGIHHLFTKKRLHILALKANHGIEEILSLMKAGKLQTKIDGPYPFERLPWAVQRFGNGDHHGKVVISMDL